MASLVMAWDLWRVWIGCSRFHKAYIEKGDLIMGITDRIKVARRCAVPLVGITSADGIALEGVLRAAINGSVPLIRFDIVAGCAPLNEPGDLALSAALGSDEPSSVTDPVDLLKLVLRLQAGSIVLLHNAHRLLDNGFFVQGLLNCREVCKSDKRMVVLIGPSFNIPAELQNSIELFDEPLPDRGAIGEIVSSLLTDAGLPVDEAIINDASDALVGLSPFAAEQSAAMAISKSGISIDDCLERKRKSIEQTKGLKMFKSAMRFSDLGGLESAKRDASLFFNGPKKPRIVVWVDEIEKMMAGAGTDGPGDNTGVSQDFNGVILREMEMNGWRGIILLGPPGSGKSAFAQSLGGEFGVPLMSLDLGGMKSSGLGESEGAIRGAMKTIAAVGGESVYFVATCNKLQSLPAEFKRRFRMGLWFFDLPDDLERESIWRINMERFRLSGDCPTSEGWSGANIRDCCDIADCLGISVADASKRIISAYTQDKSGVDNLRRLAHGCFLSASYSGAYRMPSSVAAAAPGRKIGGE
jgi:hypothetical protein